MDIKNPWKRINQLMKPKRGRKKRGRLPDSKKLVLELVERRNDIVHEGDMYLGKKYHAKLKSISRDFVSYRLKKLRRIVESIHTITSHH